MEGLDITEKDRVLAVGGSGDQAFAMLEKADKVGVIDISREQSEFIYHRAILLAARDYNTFLRSAEEGVCDDIFDWTNSGGRPNEEYFLKPGRLPRIKSRLDRLELFPPRSIVGLGPLMRGYNKIYLSNAKISQQGHMSPRLDIFAAEMPMWGLIYFSDNSELSSHLFPGGRLHSTGFILEEALSRVAQAKERNAGNVWTPEIYKKVIPFRDLPFAPNI